MKKYTAEAVVEKLSEMDGWEFQEDGIEKKFVFRDFIQAMGFLNQLALYAEKANHHAEIFNVYNRVNIRLSTHDAGGVTDKDFQLALQIDNIIA
jgi:4a-hydroxytetrahydrobiopterin dehydratase